jgi:hypothetical protein
MLHELNGETLKESSQEVYTCTRRTAKCADPPGSIYSLGTLERREGIKLERVSEDTHL